jgi:hypothetical protein
MPGRFIDAGVVRIRRGLVRVGGRLQADTPKSEAGVRDVAIPPHLIERFREHLFEHTRPGAAALLFPSPANPDRWHQAKELYEHYHQARAEAGRPDLRWHDLRHTGAVLAAATGATLAELMARLGHSTAEAALRYQHACQLSRCHRPHRSEHATRRAAQGVHARSADLANSLVRHRLCALALRRCECHHLTEKPRPGRPGQLPADFHGRTHKR